MTSYASTPAASMTIDQRFINFAFRQIIMEQAAGRITAFQRQLRTWSLASSYLLRYGGTHDESLAGLPPRPAPAAALARFQRCRHPDPRAWDRRQRRRVFGCEHARAAAAARPDRFARRRVQPQ